MNTSLPDYDLKSVRMPYLAGKRLRLFTSLLEGRFGGLLLPGLFESAGVQGLRARHFDEPPTPFPLYHTRNPAPETARIPETEWPQGVREAGPGFHFATVSEYARAYRRGEITPEDVARKILEAITTSDSGPSPLRAFIAVEHEDVLRQAHDATRRILSGRALGILDGVPVAVKDELDLKPYPTTVGTAFLGQSPVREDAAVVARLRAAGALLIGKTNMHEIGIGVTGLNPHHGTVRNPYHPAHFTGGSSSGSAAAVAAGLCPIAIGADGGGSIRIPAAFCGVVGLKPTFGRVSERGAAPLCWSVAHVGPLAATVADAALAYALIAGPDAGEPLSCHQPSPTLGGWDIPDLTGVTLGVYWPWFRHASGEVVSACEALLKVFEQRGAAVREIVLPDLEAARVAHSVTIAGEMAQALSQAYAEHHHQHGLDVRINLALARAFTTLDYVKAQRVRTHTINQFRRALEQVDTIVTPTTALAAPAIPAAALPEGESDLSTLVEIMRFVTPANLTGLPAISFPAGYTPAGLPVGMQAIGRPWQEAGLLRLARVAELNVTRQRPKIFFPLLA